ncbi:MULTISPECIES: hypothetical protein [Aeromonas]|uniref:Uncharacterized protein n=1 Tax=Aeromonas salmonicida TaxID=645 RepID=A0AAX1PDW8_AERSA|nr:MULTISPECIES: hypothetical protein [Aeromonas]MDU4190303.1 hypothetical protein [Aeromonas sp.]RAI98839.1 hypothetical protein DEU50_12621 [Aeromonas salmonicida]
MAKYRYGLFQSPAKTDPSVDDLQVAEDMAREMSRRLNGEPVAVWGENDETLTLFAGFEQFKPV